MAAGTGGASSVSVTLRVLPGEYAISRLEPDAALPGWADGPGFVSIVRTADELSILCEAERVPLGVRSEPGWSGFQFVGPFAFDETGIAASVLQPLADAGIGIVLVSTFDTDYLFVKTDQAGRAAEALTAAGHVVAPSS